MDPLKGERVLWACWPTDGNQTLTADVAMPRHARLPLPLPKVHAQLLRTHRTFSQGSPSPSWKPMAYFSSFSEFHCLSL